MFKLKQNIKILYNQFCADTSGSTAIEYGLIGAMIFVAILGSVFSVGDSTTLMFKNIGTAITTAIGH